MSKLNMCMFGSRVEYDAAVRRQCVAEEQQAQNSPQNTTEALTKINSSSTMLHSLEQE